MEPTCSSVSVSVLLGVFDSTCPSLYCSPYENKIGGYPDQFTQKLQDFYSSCTLSSPPSCRVCGNALALLVQVYCPLENTVYHRLMQVFCCVQSSCHAESKSWLILRSQFKDETPVTPGSEQQPVSEDLFSAGGWCDGVDDWGSSPPEGTISSSFGDVLDQQMGQLVIGEATSSSATTTSSAEQDASTKYLGPFYPPGYLQVIEEPDLCLVGEKIDHVRNLLKKYQCENPDIGLGLGSTQSESLRKGKKVEGSKKIAHSETEGYEKVVPKHGDRAFQKFQKKLARCPQQLLRYSHGGEPLLFTDNPAYMPPKPSQIHCKECGAPCVFEFQLMPTLVYLLQTTLGTTSKLKTSHDQDSLTYGLKSKNVVEFGTLLVYTCSKSCWTENSSPKIEVSFVQMDTDQIQFPVS